MLNRKHIIAIKKLIRKIGLDVRRTNPVLDKATAVAAAHALSHNDILALYFRSVNPAHFFFLQIGANDGKMQDPLRPHIRRYGLKGCLLEPQPKVFQQLQKNYADQPQLSLQNVAVAAQEGTTTLYTFPEDLKSPTHDINFSGFASFDRSHVINGFNKHALRAGIKGKAEDYLLEISVITRTIPAIMQGLKQPQINYLQIDTEGFDFEIIKLIDFKTYQPDIIFYEHSGLSDADKTASWTYLKSKGYICAVAGMDTLAYKQ